MEVVEHPLSESHFDFDPTKVCSIVLYFPSWAPTASTMGDLAMEGSWERGKGRSLLAGYQPRGKDGRECSEVTVEGND